MTYHTTRPRIAPATAVKRCAVCGEAAETPVAAFGVSLCSDPDCYDTLADAGEYASAQSQAWPPVGRVPCPSCNGTGQGQHEYHYVRGHGIRNECPNHRCNGLGHVPASIAAEQEHTGDNT